MKKWSILTCLMLLLAIPLAVQAEESTTLTAAAVTAQAGQTVSVPITIQGNPGFTNFSLRLEYDRSALELISFRPGTLCGSLTRTNENLLICARAEQTGENGVIATAEFKVRENFSGIAAVTARADYIRCGGDDGVFKTVSMTSISGSVRVEQKTDEKPEEKPDGTGTLGDVNGDGRINALDAALVYDYLKGTGSLTEQQLAVADVDGNGIVDRSDAIWIYRYVNHRAEAFPKTLRGDKS